ncbi:unnamed protein product [Rotaria socialis]|uniref:TTF-type domain-containing protein n=5 Tax=Rotaria socialis TaxID=392032 RepID=A0A818AI85_9BILA|nr:unnamed protein product [Rotaria socialis]
MSTCKNSLTNYFKKRNITDNVEEANQVVTQSNPVEEIEVLHTKRLKPNELTDSTTLTTNNTSASTSMIRSTTTSSTLSSPNERDPCHGPAKAKVYILLGPFQPKTNFPTVNGRHFRAEWYNTYPWLEYSLELNRAFCFPCRLRNERKNENPFTITGFHQWKNGTLRLNDHQAASWHKESFAIWKITLQNYNNNTDVLKLINQQHSKQATENRVYLRELIRTAHFLTRQGVSFRGHRENVGSKNRGNFLELLELRSNDNEIIKKKKEEIQFTDYKIQNELIDLMSKQVLNRILREIQQAKYFSIMIDETTDISKLEQVSLVVRYTDDQFKVHERFMGFARTTEMTGEALFNLLLEWLKKLNLDVKNIVAQSYDGASAMRGEYKGVAARLKQIAPCGIYIHCNGHILNLCLVDVSTRVSSIRNNFGIVSSLYNLIENSAKRHAIFEEIQEEAGLQSLTIKQMSDTRWTCRWDCLKVVLIRYPQIISTLQLIEAPESHLLLHSMESFDFVFHLFIMSEIYLLTNILSKYLQSSQISISQALKQVKMTVDTLKSLRNETEFERFYSKALQMCEENEIDPPKVQRKKKVPARLGGGDKDSTDLNIKDHYRINTYYAVLDTIITSIENRFDENMIHDILLMEKLFLTK